MMMKMDVRANLRRRTLGKGYMGERENFTLKKFRVWTSRMFLYSCSRRREEKVLLSL